MDSEPGSDDSKRAEENAIVYMTGQETAALVDSVQTWRYGVDARQHGFFLAKKLRAGWLTGSTNLSDEFQHGTVADEAKGHRPTTPGTPGDKLGFTWIIGSLIELESGFFEAVPLEDQFFAFTDPSTYPTYPGWMLRNLLVLIRRRWKIHKVQILCYRDVQIRRDDAKSIILSLEVGDSHSTIIPTQDISVIPDMPKVTGWERTSGGKVMSRIANLGEYMDPQRYSQGSLIHD